MIKYVLFLWGFLAPIFAYTQTSNITVMTYNILGYPNSNTSTLDGNAARATYFREIVEGADADIIILQEVRSDAGAADLVNELNTNGTSGKTYAKATSYTSYSNLGNMLIYNADLFALINETEVPRMNTTSTGAITPRAASHYELRYPAIPTCSEQEVLLHVFSGHLKASSGSSNEDRRDVGAKDLMNYITTNLSSDANIIFGGDFNLYDETEPAYETLTTGTYAFEDMMGAWTRNNDNQTLYYTQSTRRYGVHYNNGGANGGLDDRFDFWLQSNAVTMGISRVQFITDSYETFGLTGVATNGGATEGSHNLKTQIELMSDHYPVIMQLEMDAPLSLCNTCAPTDHLTGTINSNIYQTSIDLSANGTIAPGESVILYSHEIELQAGFCLEAGAELLIDIQACTP